MIEYLRHIQSISRREEYVIQFPVKYSNEKKEDDIMTTGKLLEFISKNEQVDISDTESVDQYTWLFDRELTTDDIDYIYDEPLVSGYNPIPFNTEINNKFSDNLLKSYDVYRSGIFESDYYDCDVIGNVLYTMASELPDTELLYTAEECYIIKNGAIQDNDPYAAGILIDWEMPWISEPVKIGYLSSYSPVGNVTFEEFINGVFDIYNQIKTTENSTGTLPIPNIRTMVEGHYGTNYINSWIHRQLTHRFLEVPDHVIVDGEKKRIEWYVEYDETSGLGILHRQKTQQNEILEKSNLGDSIHKKYTYSQFLSFIENLQMTYKFTVSNSIITVKDDAIPVDENPIIEFFDSWESAKEVLYEYLTSNEKKVEICEFLQSWQYCCSKLDKTGKRKLDNSYNVGVTFIIHYKANRGGRKSIPSDKDIDITLDMLLNEGSVPEQLKSIKMEDIEMYTYEIQKPVENPVEPEYFKSEKEAIEALVKIIIESKSYSDYSQEMKKALHEWQQLCSKLPNGDNYDVGKTFKIDMNPVGGEFDPKKVYTLDKLLSTPKLPDEFKIFSEEGLKGITIMIPYNIYCEELYPNGGEGIKEEDVEVQVDDFYTNWENAKNDLLTFINMIISQQGKKRSSKPMTNKDIQGSLHRWQYLCSHLGPDGNAQMNLDDLENVVTPSSTGVTFKITIKDSSNKRHELYLDELLSGNGITLLKSAKEVISVEMHPYLIDRSGEIDDDEPTEDDSTEDDDEDPLKGIKVVEMNDLDQWLSECEIITYEQKQIKKYNLRVEQSMEEIFKYYNKMAKELYGEKWKFKDNDPSDSPKGELIPKFNWNVIETTANDYNRKETQDFWEEMEAQRNIYQDDTQIKILWCLTCEDGTYISEFKPESSELDETPVDTFMVQQYYNKDSTMTEQGKEVITVFRYKNTFNNEDDLEELRLPSRIQDDKIVTGKFITEIVPKNQFKPLIINSAQPFSDFFIGKKVGVIDSDPNNKVGEDALQYAYLILERDSDVDGPKVPKVVRVPKNKK